MLTAVVEEMFILFFLNRPAFTENTAKQILNV